MRFAAAALLAIGVLGLCACGSGTHASSSAGHESRSGGLPAAVTFKGVGGVTLAMGSAEVGRIIGAPVVEEASGTSAVGHMPFCAKGMGGEAIFFGPDANVIHRPVHGSDSLLDVWFTQGTKTDRGVGIGSTRSQVLAAYRRTDIGPANGGLLVTGAPVSLGKDKPSVTPAIYFAFLDGKVWLVAYGRREVLVRGQFGGARVFCP